MMRSLAYPAIAHGSSNLAIPCPQGKRPLAGQFSSHPMPKISASISQLIKHFQIPLSPQQANLRLRRAGILMPMYRPSLTRFDRLIRMYVVTRKGLDFGENRRSPVHPIQTTPHFYYHSFLELAELCEFPSPYKESLEKFKAESLEEIAHV